MNEEFVKKVNKLEVLFWSFEECPEGMRTLVPEAKAGDVIVKSEEGVKVMDEDTFNSKYKIMHD
jgi:hypothetical protein